MLSGILVDARRCNTRDGVTGALVCRNDVFLQLLEGPEAAVEATLARIARDDRHVDVTVRVSKSVAARMFGDWAMLHDPATSWIWSAQEISGGALDRAAPEDYEAIFETLARQAAAGRAT